MGNVGQSMSVQPLLPIGENALGKEKMQIHILIHKYKLLLYSTTFTVYNTLLQYFYDDQIGFGKSYLYIYYVMTLTLCDKETETNSISIRN